ncbi:MAG: tRNA uridine-5-carboxymethylaminomethyl(34) synthesis enzyme MnmG [Anaerolineae bacterium]
MYDVIVVGAGHAGCEAALAAARMGRRVLLVTMNLDLMALMPCNPSVGGPAKAHLVREVDALGGAMAAATDRALIQIRMLNASRGPAVQSLRAQVDKRLYALVMAALLESTAGLDLLQGQVVGLETERGRVSGVRLSSGEAIGGRAVVLAAGTFLNGELQSGEQRMAGGRAGEAPAQELPRALAALGLRLGRLQTNTPPRVDARSIDYSKTVPQYGSEVPLYFSQWERPEPLVASVNPAYPIGKQTAWRRQLPCYLVQTNTATHRVIRENLHRSAVVTADSVAGPRYCPSIEDKILRYPDKESHQLFLEPEGWSTNEVYVQGCFTGLPAEVQQQVLETIPALAEARIVRPGYAVAYDYVLPSQLTRTLAVRSLPGLYMAGQLNGTSGYEEAAAQGVLAGANAALFARDEEPLVIGREQGYLGVLVDDLVTRDIDEPYRMLTSRAEYRLLLRQDNADLRLTAAAHRAGLVSDERFAQVQQKQRDMDDEIVRLGRVSLAPDRVNAILLEHGLEPLTQAIPAAQLLRRPGTTLSLMEQVAPREPALERALLEQVFVELQYAGYVAKQQEQVARNRRMESWTIPADWSYANLQGMRLEARERLERHRPETVGQAARITGVNPADIAVLLIHLRRWQNMPKDREAAMNAERPAAHAQSAVVADKGAGLS